MQGMLLLAVVLLASGCGNTPTPNVARATATTRANNHDERLVGEWEHSNADGSIFLLNFQADGSLTATTTQADGKVIVLNRRWESEIDATNGKRMSLHRWELEGNAGSTPGIEMIDVVTFLDDDRITVHAPADTQPLEYHRKEK